MSILPYRDYDEFKDNDTCMFDCDPLVFLTKLYSTKCKFPPRARQPPQYLKITRGEGTKSWEQSRGCNKGPLIGGPEDHTPVGEPEFGWCVRISSSRLLGTSFVPNNLLGLIPNHMCLNNNFYNLMVGSLTY